MSSTLERQAETHPIVVPAIDQCTLHAQSDCGHGSPQLGRGYSLLRSFSLRNTNSSTLRKSRHQYRLQLPSVSLSPCKPEGVSRPTTSQSEFHSPSTGDCSSDIDSSSAIWKKWRVTSVSEHSGVGEDSLAGHDDTMPSPTPRGTERGLKKKRSLFLPSITVSRLIAPFQISSLSSSPSSEVEQDSSRVLTAPHGFDTRVTVLEDEDGFVGLIRQVDGRVDRSKVGTQNQLHTKTRSNLDLGLGLRPTNQVELQPPLLPVLPITSPLGSLGPMLITSDASGLPPPSSSSTPTSQSSSNSTSDLNLNLKSSISQKRRAMFTLGNESDLDSDSLGVSASVSKAAVKVVSNSNVGSGSTPESIMVLPNNSTQTTVGIPRPPLTQHERFVVETRDQSDVATSSSTTCFATATTTSTANTRRWTLSSALTDEGTSDEGLIKELEKMREILQWEAIDVDGHDTSPSPSPSPPIPSSPTWLTTQRALLTTRELILTERHYLSSLLMLLRPDSTLTPVPGMMISYVKELVGVSERLLKGMEGEPSVRGVAEVFVEVGGVGGQMDGDGDEIRGAESAFVNWCSVVGGWFQDDIVLSGDTQVGVKRKGKSGVGGGSEEHHLISDHEGSGSSGLGIITSSSPSSPTTTEHARTSPLMRTVSTWRRSMPSIPGLGEGGVWRRDRDKDEGDSIYGHRSRMSPTSFTSGAVGSTSMMSTSSSKPVRKPAVRDLAILPTQRVMRYVLLYRDLLANTPPSSSSYPIVERAVEVACRIAEKCDRAQANAAFIVGGSERHSTGSSSSGSSSSMLNNSRRCGSKRTMLPELGSKLKTMGLIVHTTSSSPTNSITNSPTKSYFLPSSSSSTSPSQSPPTLSLPSSPSKSKSKSTPSSLTLPASPIKNRVVTTPPSPPSSFPSKIPRSGRSFGSSSTYSTGFSSDTTTTTTSSSSFSSSSASSAFFLPKSASSP